MKNVPKAKNTDYHTENRIQNTISLISTNHVIKILVRTNNQKNSINTSMNHQ